MKVFDSVEINSLEQLVAYNLVPPPGMKGIFPAAGFIAGLNSGDKAHALQSIILAAPKEHVKQLNEIGRVETAERSIRETKGKFDAAARQQVNEGLDIILNSGIPDLSAHHLLRREDRNIHVLTRIGKRSHIGMLATEIFLEKIINYRVSGATAYGPLSAKTIESMIGSKGYNLPQLRPGLLKRELTSKQGAEFLNELISQTRYFINPENAREKLKKEGLEVTLELYDSLPKRLKNVINKVYSSLEAIRESKKAEGPVSDRISELSLKEQLHYHVSTVINGIGQIANYNVKKLGETSLADRFTRGDKYEYVTSRQRILYPYVALSNLSSLSDFAREAILEGIERDYNLRHSIRAYDGAVFTKKRISGNERKQLSEDLLEKGIPPAEIKAAMPKYIVNSSPKVVITRFDPTSSMSTLPAYEYLRSRVQ